MKLRVGVLIFVVPQRWCRSRVQPVTGPHSAEITRQASLTVRVSDEEKYTERGRRHVVIKAGPKFELLATNKISQSLMATLAISSGMMFVQAERNLFAIAL